MSINEGLKWRYATKKMNGEQVSSGDLLTILNNINLSASSYGLQPYNVVVVKNQELKDKLQIAAYGQTQIGSSSAVIVFAIAEDITEAHVDEYMKRIADTRNLPVNNLENFRQVILGTINNLSVEQKQIWASKQAYIGLGTGLLAAAELNIDACPMEGFNTAEFDSILGLKEKGLKSVVIMPVGYRAADDSLATFKKVRKNIDDFAIIID